MEYTANAKKTKRAISEAFIKLLEEKTFERISIQNILEKAEVNRSTFYKYYQDKYDLAKHILNQLLKEFSDVMLATKNSSTETCWTQIFRHIEEQKRSYKSLLTIRTTELDIFTEIINGLCAMYITLGKSGRNARYEAYYFADVFYIPLFFQITQEKPVSEKEHIQAFISSLINVFSDCMRIDARALTQFIELQKLTGSKPDLPPAKIFK